MKPYNPQKQTIGASQETPIYFKCAQDTDRHQLHVHFAASGNALPIDGAAAPLQGTYPNVRVPDAADVLAADWVPLATSPTDSNRYIFVGRLSHIRLDPPGGGGVGQAVTVTYHPLPPTS